MNSSKQLKTLEELGMSQAEVARELGLSRSHLNRIRSGQREMTGPTLVRLTNLLDSHICYLEQIIKAYRKDGK